MVSLSCSNKNDRLMTSKCFVMILQLLLSPISSSNVLFAQVQRHGGVRNIQDHTVKRYFEKCFFKSTRCQDCIALPSSYTRYKAFFFASSSRKQLIFLGTPWCSGQWSPARCRPSDCTHKQLQNQLPGIIEGWSHKIAGCIYFKLPKSQSKQMWMILTLPSQTDLRKA